MLNYDVDLNVELVVHVYDVDLHVLGASLAPEVSASTLWRLTGGTALHIGWNDPLDVEILLLVAVTTATSLLLPTCGVSPSISLLLDILGRMRSAHSATHTSPTAHWL